MLRGSQTLFADIFTPDVPVLLKQRTKGRNSGLNEARNEAVVTRYWFHGTTQPGIGYQRLIIKVAGEFFLSPFTITEIIDANYSLLKQLKQQGPTVKQLKEKYPHYCW